MRFLVDCDYTSLDSISRASKKLKKNKYILKEMYFGQIFPILTPFTCNYFYFFVKVTYKIRKNRTEAGEEINLGLRFSKCLCFL